MMKDDVVMWRITARLDEWQVEIVESQWREITRASQQWIHKDKSISADLHLWRWHLRRAS